MEIMLCVFALNIQTFHSEWMQIHNHWHIFFSESLVSSLVPDLQIFELFQQTASEFKCWMNLHLKYEGIVVYSL